MCLALGCLHWLRYLILPEGEGQKDLQLALAMLLPVHQSNPDAVPEPLRQFFSDFQSSLASDLEQHETAGGLDLERALKSNDPADLNQAIDDLEDAVTATATGHPDLFVYLSNLGAALQTRFGRTGEPADLDRAVDVLEEAVAVTPTGRPDLPAMLSNLGVALRTRFDLSGDTADLDRAVDVQDLAVAGSATDHPDRPGYLSNLGIALRTRFDLSGDTVDLDRAVDVQDLAVAGSATDHPDRPGYLSNLGVALETRFDRSGDTTDLDRAVDVLDLAVAATPSDHPNLHGYLSNLGRVLQTRFDRSGDTTDLDRAVDVLDLSVAATPTDYPDRHERLSNLGVALRTRFDRSGDTTDLDRAIDVHGLAVAATPTDYPDRPGLLSNLGDALRTRFGRYGDATDVDRAVDVLDLAVAATPSDHPDRPMYMSNLGGALLTRFGRYGEATDLDRAVDVLDLAVAATPSDHPNRPMYMSNLSGALRTRFGRNGEATDLDRAVDVLHLAVAATPSDHPNRPVRLSNLGGALLTRFGRLGEATDLDRAVDVLHLAVAAAPSGYPDLPMYLSNLGVALRTRFERRGDTTDLERAMHAFRQAALVVSAPPVWRATTARRWGLCSGLLGDWPDALEAYGSAVEVLGQVAPGWLGRADQEHLLAQIEGIGPEAAAVCLQAGMPERAVELFEQGRGVLFARTLEARTDLTDLAEHHPDLAVQFEYLSSQLSRPTNGTTGTDDGNRARETSARDAKDRRLSQGQLRELLSHIRALDGFEAFLLPRAAIDLLPAQGPPGAVVLVNIDRLRSDALILTHTGVATVPLPGATPDAVAEQVDRLWDALEVLHNSDPPPDHQVSTDAEAQIESVLQWLWDTITEPVLTRLGHTGTPPEGQAWPRVWWCPSGLLAFLPLHAAGYHTLGGSCSVLDRVVSSTIPTVRALQDSQRIAPEPQTDDRLLMVGMPDTPGEPPLGEVSREAITLTELLPDHVDVLGLPDTPPATYDTVTAALPTHRWVHFSCHAHTNLDDPSQSALLLDDHQTRPLTVTDLSSLRLERADLAVLSACSTAVTGLHLPDEPIHLSAACQLAGYRHVIATLWPLDDEIAADTTGMIYRHLATTTPDGSSALDSDQAALATHRATRDLRFQLRDQPSLWATLTHTGP